MELLRGSSRFCARRSVRGSAAQVGVERADPVLALRR